MEPIEEKYTPGFLHKIIGEILIKVQTAEWALHGIVAMANENSKKNSPKFKELTLSTFLSDDPKDKNYKRQTLGQIKDFLQQANFFREDISNEIDLFVEDRNTFIHRFYRLHFHQKNIVQKEKSEYDEIYRFLEKINVSSQKWIDFSMGLLAHLVQQKSDLSDEQKQKFMEKYSREFSAYIGMSK